MIQHQDKPEIHVIKECQLCNEKHRNVDVVKSTCYTLCDGLFWFNCSKCDSTLAIKEDELISKVTGLKEQYK